MGTSWPLLLDVVLLLGGAVILGIACARIGQNPIVGYLLAGMLFGPDVLNLVESQDALHGLAELGVTLLLFTIGLEFSWRDLRAFGRTRIVSGALQVGLTALIVCVLALAPGLSLAAALAVGAIVALSSTACVLSVLEGRGEVESVHGRQVLTILLIQDLAVVPLVVLVRALGGGGSGWSVAQALIVSLLLAILLVFAFRFLGRHVLSRLFVATGSAATRELAILLAFATCLGAAWGAHRLGLSPALGAFVAGMLIADSPFATRVRADVAVLKTLFITLFFVSVGFLAKPSWAMEHAAQVLALTLAIIVGKAAIVVGIGLLQRQPLWPSIAAGICLGQVGEFSFVLLGSAAASGLLSAELVQLLTAASVLTLLVTPYLVALAPRAATALIHLVGERHSLPRSASVGGHSHRPEDHVLVVGLGPSGLAIVHALAGDGLRIVGVEMSAQASRRAGREGVHAIVGDAANESILRHAGIEKARVLVVTVPDLRGATTIIANARAIAPHVPVVVRARYHVHAIHLIMAGAAVVVDEEQEVGVVIGSRVREILSGEGVLDLT